MGIINASPPSVKVQ